MGKIEDHQNLWELRQGEVLLGTIAIDNWEMFWAGGEFRQTEAFEGFRAFFNSGNQYNEENDPDFVQLDNWIQQSNAMGLQLIRLPDETLVDQFILYIEGNRANFRV